MKGSCPQGPGSAQAGYREGVVKDPTTAVIEREDKSCPITSGSPLSSPLFETWPYHKYSPQSLGVMAIKQHSMYVGCTWGLTITPKELSHDFWISIVLVGGAGTTAALLSRPGFTDQPHPAGTPMVCHAGTVPHEICMECIRPANGSCPHHYSNWLCRVR